MIVFYTERIDGDICWLDGDEYKHCIKTLRHKEGDNIHIFDENGNQHLSKVIEIEKNWVKALIQHTTPPTKQEGKVILTFVPPKNADRTELVVAKCTELNVDEIRLTKSTNGEHARYKMERLRRIAFSAAKQSLNMRIPLIREFESLENDLAQDTDVTHRFIGHCYHSNPHLISFELKSNTKTHIFIGPEGDFTPQEIEQVKNAGYQEIGLGQSRLRTETAAIIACGIIRSKYDLIPIIK